MKQILTAKPTLTGTAEKRAVGPRKATAEQKKRMQERARKRKSTERKKK